MNAYEVGVAGLKLTVCCILLSLMDIYTRQIVI